MLIDPSVGGKTSTILIPVAAHPITIVDRQRALSLGRYVQLQGAVSIHRPVRVVTFHQQVIGHVRTAVRFVDRLVAPRVVTNVGSAVGVTRCDHAALGPVIGGTAAPGVALIERRNRNCDAPVTGISRQTAHSEPQGEGFVDINAPNRGSR